MPFYLQASHSDPHRSNNQEVISQEPLQLGDTAALQKPRGSSLQAHRENKNKANQNGVRWRCTDLHLVDVGGVVPPAAQRGAGFTAAVRDHPAFRLTQCDEATHQPVTRVVAAAALELWRQREVIKQAVQTV